MGIKAVPGQKPEFLTLYPISPVKEKRVSAKYEYENNETPSIKDHVFSHVLDDSELFTNPKKQIEACRDWIETHVERRVAAFFEELIVCYKTPFHYEIGVTTDQAVSS